MEWTRVFTVTVEVESPLLSPADKQRYVLAALKRQYEGKNYMECHIVEIKSIISMTKIVADPRMLDPVGTGHVLLIGWHTDVTFNAWVRCYLIGQILTCLTVHEDTPFLRSTMNGTTVSIIHNRAFPIRKGHKVTAMVEKCEYPLFEAPMLPVTRLLTCPSTPWQYLVDTAPIAAADIDGTLMPLAAKCHKNFAARDEKKVIFFEKMYYSYSTPADGKMPGDAGGADIVDLVEKRAFDKIYGHYLARPLTIRRSSPYVYLDSVPSAAAVAMPQNALLTLIFVLREIENFSRAMNEMAEGYSEADIKNCKPVWDAVRATQQPAQK